MTFHRATALALIVVEAHALARNTEVRSLLYAAVALALVGATGLLQFRIPRWPRFLLAVMLAYPFYLVWRDFVSGTDGHGGTARYWDFWCTSDAVVVGHYLIALQVFRMFLHTEHGLGPGFAFYGAMAMACAGNVYGDAAFHHVYRSSSLAFVGLMALFLASQRPASLPAPPVRAGMKYLRLSPVLLFLLVAAGVVSGAFYEHRHAIHRVANRVWRKLCRQFEDVRGEGPSDRSELGSVLRLRLDPLRNQVVLRVFSDREPTYLRRHIFDVYDGGTWRLSRQGRIVEGTRNAPAGLPAPQDGERTFEVRSSAARDWWTCRIWPASTGLTDVYAPLGTAAVQAPVHQMIVDSNDGMAFVRPPGRLSYLTCVPVGPDGRSPESYPYHGTLHFSVPSGLDDRVRLLAAVIFRNCTNTTSKIEAVVEHFHSNYRYSDSITIPEGRDPLNYFLLEAPAAFCEYFASGAAVLLRLAGVPTRHVTGVMCTEWNSRAGGYWIARRRDAHAWVEAYHAEEGRWVIVEATPPDGLPTRHTGGLSSLWDLLKFRCQELLVAIRTEGLKGAVLWVGARLRGLLDFVFSTSPAALAFHLLVALAIASVLIRKWLARRHEMRRDPLLFAMRALLREMERRHRKHRLVRQPYQTLHEFARAVVRSDIPAAKAQSISGWYRDFALVRYRGPVSADEVQRLKDAMPAV